MNYDISEKYVVKGTAFANIRTYIDSRLGHGAFKSLAEEAGVLNPGLLVASKWYTGKEYVNILQLASKKANQSLREFCISCTTYILETDLNGVYRFFIKVGGPSTVMSAVPRMAKTYNNLFVYEVKDNSAGKHVACFRYPKNVRDWALGTVEGGLRGILVVCSKQMQSFEILQETNLTVDGEELMESKIEVHY